MAGGGLSRADAHENARLVAQLVPTRLIGCAKKTRRHRRVTQERGSHSSAASVANGHVCCLKKIGGQLDNSWIVRLEENGAETVVARKTLFAKSEPAVRKSRRFLNHTFALHTSAGAWRDRCARVDWEFHHLTIFASS